MSHVLFLKGRRLTLLSAYYCIAPSTVTHVGPLAPLGESFSVPHPTGQAHRRTSMRRSLFPLTEPMQDEVRMGTQLCQAPRSAELCCTVGKHALQHQGRPGFKCPISAT